MDNTVELLKKLTSTVGVSGEEENIVTLLKDILKKYGNVSVDSMNNVYCTFGQGYHFLLDAHLDEIGMIVTDITDDGFIKVNRCGGIDRRMLLGYEVSVWGKEEVKGIISTLPPHLQNADDEKKVSEFKDISIDVGMSKEKIKKIVSLGDKVTFKRNFTPLLNSQLSASCLDDRIGCMLMIELINSDLEYDTYFCFNVQEEVGLRGSKCTSFDIQPDISVILESTTAADLCGVTGGDRVCVLGDGPVISFMDGRTVYDKTLYNLARKTADDNNIPAQTKTAIAGGNDAGSIQTSGKGSKVIAISLPSRYIHSSSSVVKSDDIENTRKLLNKLLPKLYD